MIGYTCVGTNNLPRAAAFYDDLLAVLGAKHFFESERGSRLGRGTRQAHVLCHEAL